jgi:hypothetical protein
MPISIRAEDDVQGFLVLRHERVHILKSRDAIPYAFEGAQKGANTELRPASWPKIGWLRVQRPDVEGHVLKKAFGQHVIGMVMRVDEPGNDELPARFNHPRFVRDRGVAHDFLLELAIIVRRGHGDDSRASDKDVAHRGIVDVSIMVIDTAATN